MIFEFIIDLLAALGVRALIGGAVGATLGAIMLGWPGALFGVMFGFVAGVISEIDLTRND
jgi:hypothetical protein